MMLDQFGKTPADLGADWEDVDPVWESAMLIIHGAKAQEASMVARSSSRRR